MMPFEKTVKMKQKPRLFFMLLFIVFTFFGCMSKSKAETSPRFLMSWGEKESDWGRLKEPFDAAVGPKGFLYVTDARLQKVFKFDGDGRVITEWGDAKRFEKPTGITVSADGFVYVSDYDNDHILKFTSEGKFLKQWGRSGIGEGEFDSPSGLAVDDSGNIYVTDLYNHRVQKFSSDGRFLLSWGQEGKVNNVRSALNFLFGEGKENLFYYPAKIAVSTKGEVFVSDSYNNRVQVFDQNGQFLHKWGGMGFWGGRFRVASDIAFGPKGQVYVADFYNNRVQVFDPAGKYIKQWGEKGSAEGQFDGPTGLAVDQKGDIYVVDWANHRIQKFSGAYK
ncbi:hypothetical protein MNBD_NITROSPIRAE01-443 [hydrothermal vent metagenome]|uniref:NHL repeat domain protein n=1 Tax=hydrothermal vent metagenome TaxID=652676 RepID=A0A3B1DHU4_9ZZZZ